MKKCRKFLSVFLLLLLTILSTNMTTIFAAVGDRTTPYRAWNNHRFTFQEYDWDAPKIVEMQLMNMYTGETANNIVQKENMFNEVPAADEQWILMKLNLKYVSGPEEPLCAADVIWSENSFYTTTGQKITPISTAAFSDVRQGYDEYDVELYPGARSDVWYGILVKKTAGLPLIRVATGYNASTYQAIYKWFSTNPSYYESISAPINMQAVSNSYNSVKVSWKAVSGVSGYQIYRSTSSTGTFTKIAATSNTSYINTSLNTGTTYYYKVKAYKTGTSTTYSSFSSVVSAKPKPTVPTNFKASRLNSTSIKLTWSSVSGANGYEIYRSTSSSGTYSLLKSTTSLYYTNSSLTTGRTYYYKLRAYRTVSTKKVYSGWTTAISMKP